LCLHLPPVDLYPVLYTNLTNISWAHRHDIWFSKDF
jgi:hypothetical protein